MPHSQAVVFLAGMVTMGYLVAGAFFIRFWRQAREDLFLAFALAFWLMAANQLVSVMIEGAVDTSERTYVIRLGAFVLIAVAVLRKNAGAGRKR